MKPILWLLSVSALVTGLSGCTVFREVEMVGVQDIRVKEFSSSGIRLEADMQLRNPNGYKVKMTRADLDLSANRKYVGKVVLDKTLVLPRKFDGIHTIHFSVAQEKLSLEFIAQMFMIGLAGQADLEIEGHVRGKGMGISKKVPVKHREMVKF